MKREANTNPIENLTIVFWRRNRDLQLITLNCLKSKTIVSDYSIIQCKVNENILMTSYRSFFIKNLLQVQARSSVYEVQAMVYEVQVMENHNNLLVGGSFNWGLDRC